MQKNFRCPGCSNSMEFLPAAQKMYCAYCGSMYTVEELNALTGDSPKADDHEETADTVSAVDPWAGSEAG